jgi:hypothetical protein
VLAWLKPAETFFPEALISAETGAQDSSRHVIKPVEISAGS